MVDKEKGKEKNRAANSEKIFSGTFSNTEEQLSEAEIEPWQLPPSPEDARDLDLEDINNLNTAMPFDAPLLETDEQSSKGGFFYLAMVLLLAISFALSSFYQFLPNQVPEESFFQKSFQLAHDPALQKLKAGVVVINNALHTGTGFNLRPDGLIITNSHVLEGGKNCEIRFPDGSYYIGRKIADYPEYDLALVEFEGRDLPWLTLADDNLNTGDEVYIIGNPLGVNWMYSNGYLAGQAAADDLGLDTGISAFVICAQVYPGSSGSPIFNDQGQVAAIVFAKSSGEEDYAFAVPARIIKKIMPME